jgi:peptidoglycan/LPS O-acetylase OafA/YrhL
MLTEFLFGFAIAQATLRGRKMPPLLIALGLSLLLLAAMTLPSNTYVRPVVAGLPMALVLAGVVGMESRLPQSRVLQFFGDASYSIYLVHYAAIMLLAGLIAGVPLFLAAIGFGCVAYLIAERPILNWRNRLLSREHIDRAASDIAAA